MAIRKIPTTADIYLEADGKRVAEAMHEYMQSLPPAVETEYPDVPVVEL